MDQINLSGNAAFDEAFLMKLTMGDLITFLWYNVFIGFMVCATLLGTAVPPSRRPPWYVEYFECVLLPLFVAGWVPLVVLCITGQVRIAVTQMPFVWGKPSYAYSAYNSIYEQACETNNAYSAMVVYGIKLVALDISPYLALLWPVAFCGICVYNFMRFCLYRLKEPEKYKSLLQRVGIKNGKLNPGQWGVVLLAGYKYLSSVPRHRIGYARFCIECVGRAIVKANGAGERKEKSKTINDAEKGLWFYETELERSEDPSIQDKKVDDKIRKPCLKKLKPAGCCCKKPLPPPPQEPVLGDGPINSNAATDGLKTQG